MITGIVATAKDWGIGKKNELLFKLPADMKLFKQMTTNNIVVMGYNTLLSLPDSKPLKDRTTVVLCPEDVEPEGCVVYHDFEKLVHDLQLLARQYEIYVCGGQMLYRSFLPFYDKILVTKVDAIDEEATAFFPNLDICADYKLVWEDEPREDNGYTTKICEYVNCGGNSKLNSSNNNLNKNQEVL